MNISERKLLAYLIIQKHLPGGAWLLDYPEDEDQIKELVHNAYRLADFVIKTVSDVGD